MIVLTSKEGVTGAACLRKQPDYRLCFPSDLRRDPCHEVVQDLTIFLVLELVRKLQPQLADLWQDRIGEKLLQYFLRRADDIAGEQGPPFALGRKRPFMAALGIIAVTPARCLIGAVERHDDAA